MRAYSSPETAWGGRRTENEEKEPFCCFLSPAPPVACSLVMSPVLLEANGLVLESAAESSAAAFIDFGSLASFRGPVIQFGEHVSFQIVAEDTCLNGDVSTSPVACSLVMPPELLVEDGLVLEPAVESSAAAFIDLGFSASFCGPAIQFGEHNSFQIVETAVDFCSSNSESQTARLQKLVPNNPCPIVIPTPTASNIRRKLFRAGLSILERRVMDSVKSKPETRKKIMDAHNYGPAFSDISSDNVAPMHVLRRYLVVARLGRTSCWRKRTNVNVSVFYWCL